MTYADGRATMAVMSWLFGPVPWGEIQAALRRLETRMTTQQTQLNERLDRLTTGLEGLRTGMADVAPALQALKDEIARLGQNNPDLTAELARLDELATTLESRVQEATDLVPDAPTPEPTPAPPTP